MFYERNYGWYVGQHPFKMYKLQNYQNPVLNVMKHIDINVKSVLYKWFLNNYPMITCKHKYGKLLHKKKKGS